MSDTRRICAYWVLSNITPDAATARYDYRCVAAQSRFTGHDWTADDISCFNQDSNNEDLGNCDGAGGTDTCWVCSKYAPGGMAFGVFDPSTQGYRLPFIFDVYNLRAKISKCCYWEGYEGEEYEIDQVNGQIDTVENKCLKGTVAAEWNDPTQPTDPAAVPGTLYDVPCNGAKEECAYYTGIPWEYCVDDKMQTGDRILAQQIQELRYYSDDWTVFDDPVLIFRGRFIDPDLYAWHGTFMVQDPTTNVLDEEVTQAPFEKKSYPTMDKVSLDVTTGDMTSDKYIPTGGTPTDGAPPNYPTLIRSLNDSVLYRPTIYFPYNNYIHKHWTDNGNKVTVVGASRAAEAIYLVNGAIVTNLPSQVALMQTRVAQGEVIARAFQDDFNQAVFTFISDLMWYDPDNVYTEDPDAESGYFMLSDVELVIGKSQDLYLFSFDTDNDWSVTSVRVSDYFYHVFITETDFYNKWWKDNHLGTDSEIQGGFAHMRSTQEFDQALEFSPDTAIQYFYWRNRDETGGLLGSPLDRWSYYRVKVDVDEKTVESENWKTISACGETLVTINDTNINRPYGWEIESAQITGNLPDETSVSFELEEDYPSDLSNLGEDMPANVVILKPKSGETFRWFESDQATLTIKYKYFKEKQGPLNLADDEELVAPTGAGTLIESAPMGITYSDTGYTIDPATERTMSFRANVSDETGRIMGTSTQKLLVQYKNILCRDYEIKYAWVADFQQYQWYPTNWIMFRNRIPFELQYQGDVNKYMTPTCGDHDMPKSQFIVPGYPQVGPMWYPYTACNEDIYYQVATIANTCVLEVEGDHDSTDHRLRAPDDAYPEIFNDPHPSIWACKNEYDYGYSEKGSANIFDGYGNARGDVDLVEYQFNEWATPIFGNVLREQSWVNRSIDYINYFDWEPTHMYYDWKWMPIMEEWADQDDLFSENTLHPFMFMQADYAASLTINEYEDPVRYKYEDVVLSKKSNFIQYPTEWGTGIYYQFIDNDLQGSEATQWLYREKWKDVERETDRDNKIPSATLTHPAYAWGYAEGARVRDEFQITAEEGEYTFLFVPPEYASSGDVKDDAYFQILPGPPRYVDLETGDWKDTEALVNGGTIEPKYKDWSGGGGWNQDSNIWAESVSTGNSAEAESKGNYYKTYDDDQMEETEHYYFKGVNIELRPNYYPYNVSDNLTGTEYDTDLKLNASTGHPERNLQAYGVYQTYNDGRLNPYNTGSLDDVALQWIPSKRADAKEVIFNIGDGISPYSIDISFTEGKFQDDFEGGLKTYIGVFPGCTVYGSKNETSWTSLGTVSAVDYDTAAARRTGITTTANVSFSPTSTNIAKKYKYFKFVFGTWEEKDACLLLQTIAFKEMNFERQSESITLYERRYYRTMGASKDFVVHGTPTYSTLLQDDSYSTLYLNESRIQGIMGQSSFEVTHKCRSRAGNDKKIDKDPSDYAGPGSDIGQLEIKQSSLFDSAQSVTAGDSQFRLKLHSSFNTYLESFGMSYVDEPLNMDSASPQLSELFGEVPNLGQVWSASGHKYVNDPNNTYQDYCGGIPSPWAFRAWAWTADYCFMHYDHGGEGCSPGTSPLIIYFAGVASPTLIGGELPGETILV